MRLGSRRDENIRGSKGHKTLNLSLISQNMSTQPTTIHQIKKDKYENSHTQ